MKLLVVIRKKGYFRFVQPILDELISKLDIVIVSPDVDELFESGESCPLVFHQPIKHVRWMNALLGYRKPEKSVGWITALLREHMRGVMAYAYWALLGILNSPALDRFGRWVVRSSTLQKLVYRCTNLVTRLGFGQKTAGLLLRSFRRLENRTVDRNILDHVQEIAPDLILSIPGIYPHTWDIDYIKAGRSLKIPTIIQVASWDHLSGKGWISVVPDRLFVWNKDQAMQAPDFHAVSEESVIPIGSPSFDWIFDGNYLQSRSEFCQEIGLDDGLPFIVWAESAPGNCDDEPAVVNTLIREMQKFPNLSNCQVLIRPHPNNHSTDWESVRGTKIHIWQNSEFPTGREAKCGLYNSITHASAIVGLSTSVFLEASILDRPVGLIKTLDTVDGSVFNQSLHFEKMLQNKFPVATENETDCANWLSQIIDGNDISKEARQSFASWFFRPRGIERPSAEVAAEEILSIISK